MPVLARWFGAFFVAGATALPLWLLWVVLAGIWAPTAAAYQHGSPIVIVTNLFIEVRLPNGRVLSPLWSILVASLGCGLGGGALGLLLGALKAAWKRRG